jgi:di/tripeptidase
MRMAYSPGGIETKHLARLVPTLKELISIGPNVLNAHSPNEKVEIASINRIHTLLREFILQHFGK